MRQLIIVRKDLNMSMGKTAVQCCHASQAWLMDKIRNKAEVQANSLYQRHRSFIFSKKPNPLVPYTYSPDLNGNMAYKMPILYKRDDLSKWAMQAYENGEDYFWTKRSAENPYELELVSQDEVVHYYEVCFIFDIDTMDKWINDIYTKTICGAKNKTQLLKAKMLAEELGLKEGEDFFLIYDRCLTELQAEEQDERGGKTLTCIGFKPLPDETIQQISRKYQLL